MASLTTIHNAVCRKDTIFSKKRHREIVEKRMVFFYLSRVCSEESSTYIGIYPSTLGHKIWDHATVLHAFRTVNDLMRFNKNIFNDVMNIQLIIKHTAQPDEEKHRHEKEIMKIILESEKGDEMIDNLRTYLKAV